jgi:hypothetical protein
LRATQSKNLRLPLPLPVLAVILSAAKDPEELNEPTPSVSLQPIPSTPLPLPLLFSYPQTVISTEAAHFFVSSAAEKSASLPASPNSRRSVFADVCPLAL